MCVFACNVCVCSTFHRLIFLLHIAFAMIIPIFAFENNSLLVGKQNEYDKAIDVITPRKKHIEWNRIEKRTKTEQNKTEQQTSLDYINNSHHWKFVPISNFLQILFTRILTSLNVRGEEIRGKILKYSLPMLLVFMK